MERRPIHDILQRMRGALTSDTVTVGALLHAMDSSAQPVILLLPALILVSPLSGIPGLSTLGGLTIALIAAQILIGRQMIWLPGVVLRRSFSAKRLASAIDRLERPARLIDRNTAPRMAWFFDFPGQQLAQATCVLCGLAMPFLELVPFSATTLATAVVILAVGLLVRDGLFAAIGLASFGLAVALIVSLIF